MLKKALLVLILILAAALRLYQLDKMPWGLNADEAAIGYNAYSLIQTGRDEHGVSWPLVFRSFDDYKPPVYFYLVLPFVKLLGLTIWAVRLPSALLGIATVYLTYLLCIELFSARRSDPIGLFSAFLLAISPWHLQYSRGGWEVNAGLFFLTLGLWAFFRGLKNPKLLILATISWVISLYTYHSLRIVTPILGLYLILSHLDLFRNSKLKIWTLASFIIGFILLVPLAIQFITPSGGTARFQGVSIFADSGPLSYVLEMRRTAANPDSLLTKIQYNRYTAYAFDFLKNYFSHYSYNFLFVSGDEIARNKVPGMGQTYLWTLPFLFLGLLIFAYHLTRREVDDSNLIYAWFLVAPAAAALTFQSPHALRAENMVVPLCIISAVGISAVANKLIKLKIVFAIILLVLASTGVTSYLKHYYIDYPQQLGYAWQPGFSELSDYLSQNGSKYDKVIISTRYDQPYILLAFFLKYPPAQFQKELVFSTPDQFGFSTGTQFHKYYFHAIDWPVDSQNKNSLVVVADEEVDQSVQPVKTINFPDGSPVFRLYETEGVESIRN